MTWFDSAEFALRRSPPPLDADEVHLWFWRDTAARGREGRVGGAAAPALPAGRLRRCGAGGASTCVAKPTASRAWTCRGAGFNLSHGGLRRGRGGGGVDPGVDVELPRRSRATSAWRSAISTPARPPRWPGCASDKREAAFHARGPARKLSPKADGRGLAYGLQRVVF